MATITAFEAKPRFGELLERVAKGEEVVITRHDRPVARLIPEGVPRLDEVRRSIQGLRDLQQRIRRRSKAKLSDREVRARSTRDGCDPGVNRGRVGGGLPLRLDHDAASLAFSRLSELASAYRLTVYDAAYLELAQRRQLVLAYKDGPLGSAADQAGVRLWR